MKKLRGGEAPCRCRPLTEEDLIGLFAQFNTEDYDDCLFLTIILCGFHALLRVGELMQPDQFVKRSFVKICLWTTLNLGPNIFLFHLPYHKGDQFFEGNVVMIHSLPHTD